MPWLHHAAVKIMESKEEDRDCSTTNRPPSNRQARYTTHSISSQSNVPVSIPQDDETLMFSLTDCSLSRGLQEIAETVEILGEASQLTSGGALLQVATKK